MSELKPCPFCGGNNLTIERLMYVVFCNDCGAEMSGNAPLGNWNTRPIEDALNARIAELEAENAKLKAEPKPLAYWSDEKKQTYADNEGRSAKGARNE